MAPSPTRRQLLLAAAALAGAALLPGRDARGIGRPTRVGLATLAVPGGEPFPRPGVPESLLFELGRYTSVDVRAEVPHLSALDRDLFDFPLILLAGSRAFPPLPDDHRDRLGLHLRSGGLLFADDTSGLHDSGFAQSVEREARALFPGVPLARLERGHALHRSFFLIHRVVGRLALRPYVEGVTLGDITPLILCRNDLMGALARDPAGGYLYAPVPGGEEQRMWAFKLAINLMMYALTLNYKLDATHVRALLEKRRGVYDE